MAFSLLENWGSDVFDESKPLGSKLAQQQECRNQTSTAPAAPRGSSEGTSSSQRPRAQRKHAAGHAAPIRQEDRLHANPICQEDRLHTNPIRQEDRLHANENTYAPRAARAETGILGCDGCGREGHTAEQCYFRRHLNWNTQHSSVKWKDSAIAK